MSSFSDHKYLFQQLLYNSYEDSGKIVKIINTKLSIIYIKFKEFENLFCGKKTLSTALRYQL